MAGPDVVPIAASSPAPGSGPPSVSSRATTEASPTDAREATRAALVARRRRRIWYSLTAIVVVLAIGTIGFYYLVSANWVTAFYIECMVATGQGPPFAFTTDASKLFASFMAFVSVGTVVSTLIVNLGPVMGRLWREGMEEAEHEVHKLEQDISREFRERR